MEPRRRCLVEEYVIDLAALVDRLGLKTVSLLGNATVGRVAQESGLPDAFVSSARTALGPLAINSQEYGA